MDILAYGEDSLTLWAIQNRVETILAVLEIDGTSVEGISQSNLENKINETISQIGATLVDENGD